MSEPTSRTSRAGTTVLAVDELRFAPAGVGIDGGLITHRT